MMITVEADRAPQIEEGLISLCGGKADLIEMEEGFFPIRVDTAD